MTGICGWDKTPCLSPRVLDDCGVCGGTNQPFKGAAGAGMNLSAHLGSRAVSGLCNYQGIKCGCTVSGRAVAVPLSTTQRNAQVCVPATVSVCGTCILLDSRWELELSGQPSQSQTFKNVGICDCSGNGVPGGGAVVDRCGVCDGRNASMDYCGISPAIPASAVCHTGASAAADSTTWNLSCTGCNGVPNPFLPWFPSPSTINRGYGIGGVRVDVCGVCGGDSSTCAGCDGVPGSATKLDSCGVCGGDDSSCRGCDGKFQLKPKVNDSCGVCGGSQFGACGCDYQANTDAARCSVGCDGVLGSGLQVDACGVCGGDGSQCAGCDGMPWSGKVWDSCGSCTTPSLACQGCDNVRNSFRRFDCNGVCNGGGLQCKITPCSSGSNLDECGACALPGAENRSCGGCDGIPYSMQQVDICGVCDGNGRGCMDRLRSQLEACDGVSGHIYDFCGVCNGPGPDPTGICADPSVHSVQAVLRLSGVSSITSFQGIQQKFITSLLDAASNPSIVSADKTRVTQVCGASGTGLPCNVGDLLRPAPPTGAVDVTFEVQTPDLGSGAVAVRAALRRRPFLVMLNLSLTLSGVQGVTSTWVLPPCFGYDACGRKCGDSRNCLICGPCGRNSTGCIGTDACGKCGGDGSTCKGCNGISYSGRTYDACGICGGDGSTCRGCDGIPNSGATVDRCGVCSGGNRDVDICGCCPATTPLCYLNPTSRLCPPLCNADNTTCMGCDRVVNSGLALDACGVCGGTNLCKFASQTVVIGGRRALDSNETDEILAGEAGFDLPQLRAMDQAENSAGRPVPALNLMAVIATAALMWTTMLWGSFRP
jgi:hypothetical protein